MVYITVGTSNAVKRSKKGDGKYNHLDKKTRGITGENIESKACAENLKH